MTGDRGRELIKKVASSLKKLYGSHRVAVRRSALEELFIGILADGISERKAAKALAAVSGAFVDWNEVRVTAACEIAAAMPAVPEATEKALHLRRVLQKVYDLNNELSLDYLKEKSPRDAARLVADIPGFPESALARATLLVLGHDVLPLTPGVLRMCRRIGFLADGLDHPAMLDVMGKLIARPRMYEFHRLASQHAAEVCLPDEPACEACCLRADCRTGRSKPSSAAERTTKKKSKGSKK